MFLELMRSKNQRVIAKRTSQIMKYGQDVITQIRTIYRLVITDILMGRAYDAMYQCCRFEVALMRT